MIRADAPAGTGAILEIDLAAIVANWRMLCVRHRSGPVAAVVKADAYGLGARLVAPALREAGCQHFFVALLDEALAIRALLPGVMVAVLNGLLPGSEDAFVAHDITPVLGSLGELESWTTAGRQAGRRLPAILHVDTGMARLGLDRAELATLRQNPARLGGVDLLYIISSSGLFRVGRRRAERGAARTICGRM